MRVMVFVKATEDSEAGFRLTTEAKKMMQEMDKFNNELRAADRRSSNTRKPSGSPLASLSCSQC